MTVYDSATENLNRDGSSLLQAKLSATEAQSYKNDPSAQEGWYNVGWLQGGDLGPETAVTDITDEAGELLGQLEGEDKFVIKNFLMESDTPRINLFRSILRTPHDYRYFLPKTDAKNTTGYQAYGIPNGIAAPGYKRSTKKGELRGFEFTITAGIDKDLGDNHILVDVDVDLTDQTTAPWTTTFARFAD